MLTLHQTTESRFIRSQFAAPDNPAAFSFARSVAGNVRQYRTQLDARNRKKESNDEDLANHRYTGDYHRRFDTSNL